MRSALGLLAAAALLGACAAQQPAIKPAPAAISVVDDPYAATSAIQGVRVTVDSNAWQGDPNELRAVVPALVSIRNGSGRPLRLRYDAFDLLGPTGTQLAALPPLAIGPPGIGGSGELDAPVQPRFTSRDLLITPTAQPVYPTLPVWTGPFTYATPFPGTTRTIWPEDLPSRDMVERAIPEGVLLPDGEVTGFLFFRDIPEGVDRVLFRAQLVDAQTEQPFGTVEIPFVVTGG